MGNEYKKKLTADIADGRRLIQNTKDISQQIGQILQIEYKG